jgi:two-component system OmpR family sensor kinase
MSRLWVRLVLAFGLVIAVTTGVVAVLARERAADAFKRYASFRGAPASDELLASLAAHYEQHGTWEGVEWILRTWARQDMRSAMSGRMRPGFSFPAPVFPQVLLTDARGHVLYDGTWGGTTRTLNRDELSAAETISVDGQTVGSLVVAMPMEAAVPGPLEERFFEQMREALTTAWLVAGALGLMLALTLSRSLSAPLQRLAAAARTLASGDLAQRVQVGGGAEVAEVGSAFNEMAQGLQKAEEVRRNLMADVAHELRTPLTVLRGNLQAMLEGLYPANRDELRVLYDETQLLGRLVDDVRELALVDAGQLRLELQPTDLGLVLASAADRQQATGEAQGVTLTVDMPTDLPLVLADVDRLAQVLHNLLGNALRHTPAGGSIVISATAAGDVVEVAVRDTGSGIDPEHLAHIFDRFWRSDPSRSRETASTEGTGLGLSITRSLVEAHGGRIWAESAPGHGATFRFTLPTANREE